MANDYNLYGDEPPHQKHSETSHAAARKARHRINKSHQKILGWMSEHPDGGCDERVAAALSMSQNTYRPRRCELFQMGYLIDSGRKERTQSGNEAAVWVRVSSPFPAGAK
ncbi:hypothetical protein [Bradyrhizobium sp. SEMIA]|uniref:hypothetical protein n=1 Tax=Bradyrhizobium sp. SEMIA TaxID=2597515 RepID=UPI0018A3FE82|nr:hypothetical protein [Bradyrhizobium sp. SEMIA]QOG21356.1 hypothetical protein FOM02_32640 [Bradyrhizobium sp. SEMIA]